MPKPRKGRGEIRITVDGAEFYSMARALKRVWGARSLGEVVMAVKDGKLSVDTARGGCLLACTGSGNAVARLTGSQFYQVVSVARDAKFQGPLSIVFSPVLEEVRLPHVGAKARFG